MSIQVVICRYTWMITPLPHHKPEAPSHRNDTQEGPQNNRLALIKTGRGQPLVRGREKPRMQPPHNLVLSRSIIREVCVALFTATHTHTHTRHLVPSTRHLAPGTSSRPRSSLLLPPQLLQLWHYKHTHTHTHTRQAGSQQG